MKNFSFINLFINETKDLICTAKKEGDIYILEFELDEISSVIFKFDSRDINEMTAKLEGLLASLKNISRKGVVSWP